MNPAVPGLGLGSLEWVLIPGVASALDCEQQMDQPVSFPQSCLYQADRTLLVLGMDFISIISQRACPAVFPWTSLSRDLGLVALLSPWGCFASSSAILRLSQTGHLPQLQLVFQGMLFPSPWDFAIQGHLELFTAQVLLLILTFQPFPRSWVARPAGCGRTEYFQHFLIRLKLVVFFAVQLLFLKGKSTGWAVRAVLDVIPS